jgi:hypothetical protein
MNDLHEWAQRHAVSPAALAELANVLGAAAQPANTGTGSEGRVQSLVRLAAPGHAMRLFRNNVGALLDSRGVPVRYGLANDTPALNRRLKSSDLIGWRRVDIGGRTIAQFVALECKQEGWKYRGDEHEQAQQRWLALVAADGGHARFVTGPEGME